MESEPHQKPLRYYEIDLLRFVAALVVVLYHFTYRGYHADHASPVEYAGLGEVFKYGYLGVELFFLISGYVVLLSAQGKTLGQFFVSRVTRLYPAYWVACTLTFLVVHFLGPHYHAPGWSPMLDAPLRGYLYSMTMLQAFFDIHDLDGVYWTLGYEITFYFLVGLLISFGWLKHLVLVLAVWLGYCALAGPNATGPFSLLLFPRFAPFFIAGMLFYLLQTRQAARGTLLLLAAGAYALSLRTGWTVRAEMVHTFQQPFSNAVVAGTLTLFFITLLLIVYRIFDIGPAKWAARAGALTYPVYLLHHNLGYVAFQRLGSRMDKYGLLAALLAAVLGAAYLVNRFVEQPGSKVLGQQVKRLLTRF